MKYYKDLLKLGCFTSEEAVELIGKKETANSILQQYTKKGYIKKIRRGLYVALNLADSEPVANKFVIASKLSDTAVVSHHSAFEYYGCINQVSYIVDVTSASKFNPFEFNGFSYLRHTPEIASGIYNENKIRVTDIERTVLDSINDFEKVMGFVETIQCISTIPVLNEDILLDYLKEYNKCFLYQKAGFILGKFKNEFGLSDSFFEECKLQSGNSSRYLTKIVRKENMEYDGFWRLTFPKDLWQNAFGGDINANI